MNCTFKSAIGLWGMSVFPTMVMGNGVAELSVKKDNRPNILIIFTDDQGYADLECFGSKTHNTPNMNKLAREGVMFTEFYAQSQSMPSRSALLTGRYPFKSKGINMPAGEVTFAELAKAGGYQTVCIGKWEVSGRKYIVDRMPNAQGFDYYYGTLGANDGGVVKLYENNDYVRTEKDMSVFTREYTDKAIDFLKNKRDKDKPFVIYLAHTMMHSIVDASKEFKGKSKGGLYGDVVEEFDYHTGRLIKTLDELGLRDNTLVIYTTDNGPWCQPEYYNNPRNSKKYPAGTKFWGDPGIFRDGKCSLYEGGSRVPCIMRWPGIIPQNIKRDGLMATIDFLPTFASLCGFSIPDSLDLDGVDQTSFITSRTNPSNRKTFGYMQALHSHNYNIEAVRDDRWKLLLPNRKRDDVFYFMTDFGTNDYELYDLKNDPSEKNNLVDKHLEIVERLKKELENIKNN